MLIFCIKSISSPSWLDVGGWSQFAVINFPRPSVDALKMSRGYFCLSRVPQTSMWFPQINFNCAELSLLRPGSFAIFIWMLSSSLLTKSEETCLVSCDKNPRYFFFPDLYNSWPQLLTWDLLGELIAGDGGTPPCWCRDKAQWTTYITTYYSD